MKQNPFLIWLTIALISLTACEGDKPKSEVKTDGVTQPQSTGDDPSTDRYPPFGKEISNWDVIEHIYLADKDFCSPVAHSDNLCKDFENSTSPANYQIDGIKIDGSKKEWNEKTLVANDPAQDFVSIAASETVKSQFDIKEFHFNMDDDYLYIMIETYQEIDKKSSPIGRFILAYGEVTRGTMGSTNYLITFNDWTTKQNSKLYYMLEGEEYASVPLVEDVASGFEMVVGQVMELKIPKEYFTKVLPDGKDPWENPNFFIQISTFIRNQDKDFELFDEGSAYQNHQGLTKVSCEFTPTDAEEGESLTISTLYSDNNNQAEVNYYFENSKPSYLYVRDILDKPFVPDYDIYQYLVETDLFAGINRTILGIEFANSHSRKFLQNKPEMVLGTMTHEYAHYFNGIFPFKWFKEGHSQLIENLSIGHFFGHRKQYAAHKDMLRQLIEKIEEGKEVPLSTWSKDVSIESEESAYFYQKAYLFFYYLSKMSEDDTWVHKFIASYTEAEADDLTLEELSSSMKLNFNVDISSLLSGWILEGGYESEFTIEAAKDSDLDGLHDIDEMVYQTYIDEPDTDNDFISDGWEYERCLDPNKAEKTKGIVIDGLTKEWDELIGKDHFWTDPTGDMKDKLCPEAVDLISGYAFIKEDQLCGIMYTAGPITDKDAFYHFSLNIQSENPGNDLSDFFNFSYIYPYKNYTLYSGVAKKYIQEVPITYVESNKIEFCLDVKLILDSSTTIKEKKDILLLPTTSYTEELGSWITCDEADYNFRPLIIEK